MLYTLLVLLTLPSFAHACTARLRNFFCCPPTWAEERALRIKLLSDEGKIDKPGYRGETQLMRQIHESCLRNTDNIKQVIDAGADLNAQDDDGNTALKIAVRQRKINATEELINAGADLNIQDHGGFTALMECARWIDHAGGREPRTKIIILLLNAGANIYISSYSSQELDALALRKKIYIQNVPWPMPVYTFMSIMMKQWSCDLVEDPQIQEALRDYKKRFIQLKTDIQTQTHNYVPQVLALIIADYAVDCAPPRK